MKSLLDAAASGQGIDQIHPAPPGGVSGCYPRPSAPHRARRPWDEMRHGRPGAATLGRVEHPKPPADGDQGRRANLNRRLRQAFLEGAEEDSRRRLGRGLTPRSWSGCCGAIRGMCRSAGGRRGEPQISSRILFLRAANSSSLIAPVERSRSSVASRASMSEAGISTTGGKGGLTGTFGASV
jgi:hypothetical protein